MTPADRQTLLDAARTAVLEQLPQAWAIYAYGSVARGDDTADSDLDLAVLLPPGESLPDLLDATARLAEATGRETDLVDLRRAGYDLFREVLRNGIVLHSAKPDAVLRWEAEQLADAWDFDIRRRGILDDLLQRPLVPASS